MAGATIDKTHKFQSPKGTRDFYPADLARKRHVEDAWRKASIDHGFDERSDHGIICDDRRCLWSGVPFGPQSMVFLYDA